MEVRSQRKRNAQHQIRLEVACRIEPPAPHKQNTKGNKKKETTRRPEESGRKTTRKRKLERD